MSIASMKQAPTKSESAVQAIPAAHVVHVFGSMDPGGAELRTMELMAAMSDLVTPVYVTLSGRAGTLTPQIVAAGGTVVPMPLGPRFPAQFLAFLRRARPSVLHTHVQDFSGAIATLGRTARVPIRISHYRSDGDGAPDTSRRQAYRRTMKRLLHANSTRIVGVSPTTLDQAWGPSWRVDPKFDVIPNAVVPDTSTSPGPPLRDLLAIPGDSPIVGHVGRPSPEKNRGFLVDVLAASPPDVHLVFVGPHDLQEDTKLRERAAAMGVRNRVHLTGYRADIINVMRQLDLLLLPSVREGLPGVVIEAQIAGTPVLANDLPGAGFIAEHLPGVATMRVQEGPARWAEAIQQMVQEPRVDEHDALQQFEWSPFTMSSAVPAWSRLYGITDQQ